MSVPTIINMSMPVGADKTFQDPIFQADGVTPQNVTGWTGNCVIHKYGDPATVFFTKAFTPVTPTGSTLNYPTSLQITFVKADTATAVLPDQYGHYWERTDSGNDDIVSMGLFTLLPK